MRAARFVTLCFLYAGTVLLVQTAVVYGVRLDAPTALRLVVACSVLLTGGVRLWRPEREAGNPAEYGLFAYGLAALTLALTAILVGQLFFVLG